MGINIGSLIRASVSAVGGGLQGQNEGDELLYQHRQDEKAEQLRRFVAERQMKAEDRAAEYTRAQIDELHHRHQTIDPNSPEGIAADLKRHPERTRPPERNIDPLSPEGIDATVRRDQRTSGIPARSRPKSEQTADDIKGLNSAIDDQDREVGRAQSAVPKPWEQLDYPTQVKTDSTAYAGARTRALGKVDSLEHNRDRFQQKRDSIVGAQHGITMPGTPKLEQVLNPQAGPSPNRPIGHAAGAMPASGETVPQGANPALSNALHDLQQQYEKAKAWRGANGERKDPVALEQRYLEALAKIQGSQ